ncbi:MAG: choice-of-anchor W domain-containing protein [Spirulinaceae cyanobacterium]
MNKIKAISTVAVATIGITLGATTANAASFEALPNLTDQQFNDLLTNGLFAEDFIAESRGGRNGLSGDFEIDIQDVIPPGPGGPPVDTSQFLWQNGVPVAFKLEYSGSQLTYTVGNKVLVGNNLQELPNINSMLIRTRSNNDGSVMELSDIVVDGMAYNGVVRSEDGDTIDYLKVTDIGNSFVMTGTSTLSWNGDLPKGSRLAYQIKVGSMTKPVPEPTSLLSLGLLGGFAAYTRRKKQVIGK